MRKNLGEYAVAAAVYAAFAIYLYQPHLKSFDRFHYLTFFNVWLASMGCFVLSRRWVSAFTGSIIAGAIYGFGPFVLGLGKFHPTAGLVAAAIPWLFCPNTDGDGSAGRFLLCLFWQYRFFLKPPHTFAYSPFR
jgi:hypothetical protein